jgi:cytochrome c
LVTRSLIAKKEGKMTKFWIAAAALVMSTAPSLAQDAAAGEAGFNKCKACHSIIAPDGNAIVRGGKTGPNLYGVIGRRVASDLDFKYGESLLAVGASGAVWDAASFAAYSADPKAWLVEKTGDSAAKSKMSFKLASGGEDIAAYLVAVSQ